MSFAEMPDYFENYRNILKQLTKVLDSYQTPLIDVTGHLQFSQTIADSIPSIDFSRMLPKQSFFADSVATLQFQEMIEAINKSQLQFAKDFEYITHTSQLLSKQILENQTKFNHIHTNLIADFASISSQMNEVTKSLDVFDSIRLTELAAFSSLSELPAFAQLSHNLLQSIQIPQLADFGEGFLSDLSLLLRDIAENEAVQLDDDVIIEFEERFSNHVRDVKKGRITYEGITQIVRDLIIFLTLILSWMSLQSSYDSGQTLEETQQVVINISNQIDEQLTYLQTLEQNTDSVEPQLEALDEEIVLSNQHLGTLVELSERLVLYAEQANDPTEEAILLVAKRSTLLRSEPLRNGAIITRIYPNQLVKQLKREKGWVYVEFFDYTEGIPKTGWIYRRNLVLLRE